MVRRAIRFLPSRLERDERGAVLAFVALVMVVLIGFSALAIDVGRLYVTRAQLRARRRCRGAGRGTIAGTIYAPSIHFWLETRGGLDLTGAVVADRMTFETNARVHRSGDPMSLAPGGTGLVY
jgi:hypothetical protein